MHDPWIWRTIDQDLFGDSRWEEHCSTLSKDSRSKSVSMVDKEKRFKDSSKHSPAEERRLGTNLMNGKGIGLCPYQTLINTSVAIVKAFLPFFPLFSHYSEFPAHAGSGTNVFCECKPCHCSWWNLQRSFTWWGKWVSFFSASGSTYVCSYRPTLCPSCLRRPWRRTSCLPYLVLWISASARSSQCFIDINSTPSVLSTSLQHHDHKDATSDILPGPSKVLGSDPSQKWNGDSNNKDPKLDAVVPDPPKVPVSGAAHRRNNEFFGAVYYPFFSYAWLQSLIKATLEQHYKARRNLDSVCG